jgi:hypothetical protein
MMNLRVLSGAGLTNNALYHRIKIVSSFDELVNTPFSDGVNALCWQRNLAGDFADVAAAIGAAEDIVTLDPDSLAELRAQLSPQGQAAVDVMLADYGLLTGRGLDPCLDCIPAYPRADVADVLRTDVYSFHADRAPVQTDTYLCTYIGASSEGLPNEYATRHVDIPATRSALQADYHGDDFEGYLREHSYDLHYHADDAMQVYSFGVGNLWRIAIAYPDCPVPPCIHRAPEQRVGDQTRLLLIS